MSLLLLFAGGRAAVIPATPPQQGASAEGGLAVPVGRQMERRMIAHDDDELASVLPFLIDL